MAFMNTLAPIEARFSARRACPAAVQSEGDALGAVAPLPRLRRGVRGQDIRAGSARAAGR
jgi:hypothetical protein